MLKLNPSPTFKVDVRLTVPGQETPAIIKVEFRHLTIDGLQKWYADNEGKPSCEALGLLIVSWDGVENEAAVQLGYTQEVLAALLANYPAASREFVAAYTQELTRSRVKN